MGLLKVDIVLLKEFLSVVVGIVLMYCGIEYEFFVLG